MRGRTRRGSSLAFLFVTVFVDMMGYGIVVPLLPSSHQRAIPAPARRQIPDA